MLTEVMHYLTSVVVLYTSTQLETWSTFYINPYQSVDNIYQMSMRYQLLLSTAWKAKRNFKVNKGREFRDIGTNNHLLTNNYTLSLQYLTVMCLKCLIVTLSRPG